MTINHIHAQIDGIKIIGDTCTSLTLTISPTGTSSSPYFFYNFGDPHSGTNDTITILGSSLSPYPTHTFTKPGIYNVCISFQEPGSSLSTICKTFYISLCCDAIINSSDSCVENEIPFFLTTAGSINSIIWNFGDSLSGPNNVSNLLNPTHTFSKPGNYTVTATIISNCSTYTKILTKKIVQCDFDTPCLATINSSNNCKNSSINFQISSSSNINAVSWNFGDINSGVNNTSNQINPFHVFNDTGFYTITAIINLSCGIDTIKRDINIINCATPIHNNNCNLSVPNAFSPNNDGVNDFISPIKQNNCDILKYSFLIYTRDGQLIFHTSNPERKWDGNFKNKHCPSSTYYYILQFQFKSQTQTSTKSGYIHLLR